MKKIKSLLIGIIALTTLTGCAELLVELTAKVLIPLGSELIAAPFQKPKGTLKCKNGSPNIKTKYIEDYEKFALSWTNNINEWMKSSLKLAKEEFDKGSKFVTLSNNPNYGTYIISIAKKTPFKKSEDRMGLYAKESGFRLKSTTYNEANKTIAHKVLAKKEIYFKDDEKAIEKERESLGFTYCADRYYYEFFAVGGYKVKFTVSDIDSPSYDFIDILLDKKFCDAYLEEIGYCK
ncbi:hypothetical protein [uncultured Campylobacter sp.]|uniref:hypothetical protein n=1 Tax=uncultured Campylobacter sp. TaxID=218934 RepID=UPI0026324B52|nr:hypothetical protein [uncultured Campylobacter sp.]